MDTNEKYRILKGCILELLRDEDPDVDLHDKAKIALSNLLFMLGEVDEQFPALNIVYRPGIRRDDGSVA